MKKLILFFGLIGMLSLASCDSASVKPVSLTGYVLEENPEIPFMRFPYRLEIKKNLLFAFDMASDSMFYHVLSYPGLDYLYSFGKKGNGPEEIILPTPFQFYKDELLVLDGARAKLYCYENVSQDSLRNPSFMDLGASRAVDFVKANDSVLLVEDLSGEGRLIKYSPSGNEKLYSIPQSDEHSEANALKAYLWRSFMSYNTELNKLAMATQSGDVLEIYDFESGKSQVVVGDGGIPREEDQIEGFHDIHWIPVSTRVLRGELLQAPLQLVLFALQLCDLLFAPGNLPLALVRELVKRSDQLRLVSDRQNVPELRDLLARGRQLVHVDHVRGRLVQKPKHEVLRPPVGLLELPQLRFLLCNLFAQRSTHRFNDRRLKKS